MSDDLSKATLREAVADLLRYATVPPEHPDCAFVSAARLRAVELAAANVTQNPIPPAQDDRAELIAALTTLKGAANDLIIVMSSGFSPDGAAWSRAQFIYDQASEAATAALAKVEHPLPTPQTDDDDNLKGAAHIEEWK